MPARGSGDLSVMSAGPGYKYIYTKQLTKTRNCDNYFQSMQREKRDALKGGFGNVTRYRIVPVPSENARLLLWELS